MRIWFGLLIAPLLALADQVVAYAAVGWACHHGNIVPVHGVHGLFLVLALAATLAAWQLWRAAPRRRAAEEAVVQHQFLAGLALVSGALSTLVIAALWMPTWVITPCAN
jgi:uncharacterized membrane protein